MRAVLIGSLGVAGLFAAQIATAQSQEAKYVAIRGSANALEAHPRGSRVDADERICLPARATLVLQKPRGGRVMLRGPGCNTPATSSNINRPATTTGTAR